VTGYRYRFDVPEKITHNTSPLQANRRWAAIDTERRYGCLASPLRMTLERALLTHINSYRTVSGFCPPAACPSHMHPAPFETWLHLLPSASCLHCRKVNLIRRVGGKALIFQ